MRENEAICPIELTLPADPNLMLVVRLTAAGVIARAGATVDRLDELKMAVEEACLCLMEQRCAPERLSLRFECREGRLSICATAMDAPARPGGLSDAELDVARGILCSLADEAALEVCEGRIAQVRMTAALAR